MAEPLTPDEEQGVRARHAAAARVLRQPSSARDDVGRLLATLDAERALHPVSDATPDLAAAARARLLQMANVAAEKRPMTDVARGYERACDELLEWLASEPVPATCIGCDFTGNTAAVSYINPKCPVHGTVPATDRRASDGLPVNHPDRGWINGAPVSPERPCPTCGCVGRATGNPDHALHFDPDCEECVYLARPTVIRVPATGNPEGIDVEALARALHEASPASHFRRKCRDDHYLRAEAIAAEYARQREGERP